MTGPAPRSASTRDAAGAAGLAALGLKVALAAGLAVTLSLGAERPLPMLCLLLQALAAGLGGLSLMLALVRREALRLGAWSHWHEAAVLGLAAVAAHLALLALR